MQISNGLTRTYLQINIENYVAIQHPCVLSTPEKPRSGCIMFIKNYLMKYVEGVDKNYNDAIIVYMCHNLVICGFYIPPINSKYFGDQFDIIETYSVCNKENTSNVIVCGDLNSRMGSLNGLNGHLYQENPDSEVNQHGRRLLDICKSNNLLPLNMLIINDSNKFPGGFTFNRGNLKSQNDWIIISKNFLEHVTDFKLISSLSNISDHIPIQTKVTFIYRN